MTSKRNSTSTNTSGAGKRPRTLASGLLGDELLSIEEAAALLGVSPYLMRRFVVDVPIATVRVGKFVRVRESDVRDFAASLLAS